MMKALVTNRTQSRLWTIPYPAQFQPRTRILCVSTEEEIEYYFDELIEDPEPKPTCVYLMQDDRTHLFKIGSSKKPEYRERTLQSDNPLVNLLVYWDVDEADERYLHKTYKHKRVRGEWFKLTAFDIKRIGDYFVHFAPTVCDEFYNELRERGIATEKALERPRKDHLDDAGLEF